MPLPTWYRIARSVPWFFGMALVWFGSAKFSGYQVVLLNQPVTTASAVVLFAVGLVLIWWGIERFNQLPRRLRKYSASQLKLGQEIAKAALPLIDSFTRDLSYPDGSRVRLGIIQTPRSQLGELIYLAHEERDDEESEESQPVSTDVYLVNSFSGQSARAPGVTYYDSDGYELWPSLSSLRIMFKYPAGLKRPSEAELRDLLRLVRPR